MKTSIYTFFVSSLLCFAVGCSPVDNELEKALILRVSTPKEMRNFKDNGGLNVLNSWRGYQVDSLEVQFDSGVLSLFHLVVNSGKKPVTFNNLKKDLARECGSDWDSRGRTDVYWSKSAVSSCEISEARRGGYHVVVYTK